MANTFDKDKEMQILNDLIEAVKNDIIHSLQAAGRVATGKTIANLIIETDGRKVQLTAPDYIDILERGRGPTSPNAPAGDPTVFEMIKQWCEARGIDQKYAYAITKKIHEQGYTGRPGLLSQPLSDDNVHKRADEAANNLADLILTTVRKI